MSRNETTIRATEFNYLRDCWMYALTDGSISYGKPGDARVPCGLPLNERTQWGANQILGRSA